MFYSWRHPDDVKSLCELYVPSDRKTYSIVGDEFLKGREEELLGKFAYTEALYSNNGLVMFQRGHQNTSVVRLFLYNPFSGEVIDDLPDLKHAAYIATFSSSSPTSEDCVFFALSTLLDDEDEGSSELSICRRGDQAWKTIQSTGPYYS
ncbi:hypothetical protein Tsubulata_038044 [Turnera subulata]|uniref:KIB1-4 beta-propeller domain-containing protein n=1 Tax=Turnera subulata TaxID=218843 RepID=A0A9Q0GDT2_9ROSI|nr:hypothetical protein Tsubulata_038044 [Turnera subulata]